MLNDQLSSIFNAAPRSLPVMTWGDRVQEVLDDKGWSAAELARRIGRSRSLVSQWLAGKSGPSPESVFEVADASGMSPRYLATGKGPKRGKRQDDEAHALWLLYCGATPEIRQAVDFMLRKPDAANEESALKI